MSYEHHLVPLVHIVTSVASCQLMWSSFQFTDDASSRAPTPVDSAKKKGRKKKKVFSTPLGSNKKKINKKCVNCIYFCNLQVLHQAEVTRMTGIKPDGSQTISPSPSLQPLEESRRNPRAPYTTDPESRLDGDLSRHKLEHLIGETSKKA